MASRVTYDEALKLTRGELIDRLLSDVETLGPHPDVAEYGRILRLIDLGEVIADTYRVVAGLPGPSYLNQRPDPLPKD